MSSATGNSGARRGPVGRAVAEDVPMRDRIILRRTAAITAAIAGWAAFLAIGFWAAFSFDPAKGQFAPQWTGFALIGTVAVALAGGISASRLKLGETISAVSDASFRAGYESCERRYRDQGASSTVRRSAEPGVTGGRRVR